MAVPLSFSAVLLAAGRSSRMGSDKALLSSGGEPLWRRQLAVLQQAGAAEIFLSVRADQTWVPEGFSVVRDPVEDAGPLAGIAAALARCRHSHLIVLAVDLPRVEAAWFQRLAECCASGVGAAGRGEQFFEPLAAIYPREISPLVDAALAAQNFSLQHLIRAAGDRMRACPLSPAEAATLVNWNSPADVRDQE